MNTPCRCHANPEHSRGCSCECHRVRRSFPTTIVQSPFARRAIAGQLPAKVLR